MKPKLIVLYSFPAVGKTTIAKHYLDEHSLSLCIEGDVLITMLGQWMTHEDDARRLVFSLTKNMVSSHLENSRSVVLPYTLVEAYHAQVFEDIAKENNADFFEVFLKTDKEDAINRLMERGTWGEEGLPGLTEHDLPIITKLYDDMIAAMEQRPNIATIHPHRNDIERTYQDFLRAVKEV